jgi:structural maintenance of chromosome 2
MDKEASFTESLTKKKVTASSKVEEIGRQIEELSFSEEHYNKLDQERIDLNATIAELRERVGTLSVQLEGRLRFNYSDPVRGFDRSKVKGLVAKLLSVKKLEHATALEVVAGGKLYQVVVDEAITGKALLSNGRLERRVTIIPIDKIQARRVPSATCERAKEMAIKMDATVAPAIDLVDFDEEVRTAMEYVFGSTLVVDGMKAANHICDITKTRTVTHDGDVYDPSGTISGGSKNNLGSTLSNIAELASLQRNLVDKESRLKTINSQLESMKGTSLKHEQLFQNLELAKAELDRAEKHLSQTKFGMISARYDSICKEISQAEKDLQAMEDEEKQKWKLYLELQSREKELTQQREEKLTNIDHSVREAKVNASEKTRIARKAESQAQTLRLEFQSIEAELIAAEEAVSLARKALKEAQERESDLQMAVGEANSRYDDVKAELNTVEEKMIEFSKELRTLKTEREELQKMIDSYDLDAKKLSVNIAKVEKDRGSAEKHVSNLLKKYSWIESEKSSFGVQGGDYDFHAVDADAMRVELGELKIEQENLAKKINKKVMGMIEKAEAEYTELLRKRKVVENDKKKIQAVIEELDVKKKTELERTWIKVTRDFGSIFSTLLPGASAKLEPPDGMEAWEGLEVKVAFGDVWKESLSELSGGQRSLLALSLILSLLLFKPAPMYILDEVDAALDLSHTQNIGNMLRTHFSQSQFIVVSLKEGMFNNANVIFRTKFVDGVSAVTRTLGTGSSQRGKVIYDSDDNDGYPDKSAKKKQSGPRSRKILKENIIK